LCDAADVLFYVPSRFDLGGWFSVGHQVCCGGKQRGLRKRRQGLERREARGGGLMVRLGGTTAPARRRTDTKWRGAVEGRLLHSAVGEVGGG